jgi:hypothetical protein
MSLEERHPDLFKGRHYSRWHRNALPSHCTMIDIDGVDYCQQCREPLVLIEATRDIGAFKPTTVLCKLAKRADLRAWLIYYTISQDDTIASFRVQQVHPTVSQVVSTSPEKLRARFVQLHAEHKCRGATVRNLSTAA